MSRRAWFNSWFKPSNLIALAVLIVTTFGVFAGMKFFTKNQAINLEENCDLYNVEQNTSGDANLSQTLNCNNSKGRDIIQEQQK